LEKFFEVELHKQKTLDHYTLWKIPSIYDNDEPVKCILEIA